MTTTRARAIRAILSAVSALFWAQGLPLDITGSTSDTRVTVTAAEAAAQGAPTSGASQAGRVEEWMRAPFCLYYGNLETSAPVCQYPTLPIVQMCPDRTRALDPWWMRYRRASGAWSAWAPRSGYQCHADLFAAALANAWEEMPIAPNTITMQPDTGWVLTTVPTIVYVDRAPRTRHVTLLGTPVTIRATASAYTWTWGDGGQTVTTQPGAAYPNPTVAHTYMYAERDVVVRLTTSWRGSYSTDGGASWHDAPGVAHTTSTPIPVHVYNPHSERVDCDLNGNCNTGADGPADGG
jgi:hypothetical protein